MSNVNQNQKSNQTKEQMLAYLRGTLTDLVNERESADSAEVTKERRELLANLERKLSESS